MTRNLAIYTMLIGAAAGLAQAQGQAPTKIGIINMQQAILATKDGQKANQDLNAKYAGRKQELDKMQSSLTSMNDQLTKGSATMSDDAKAKMARDMDSLKKDFQRKSEDFDTDVNQDESRLVNDLGQKMYDVIIKYATQNGLSMVIDVSNQGPVLWADQTVNIGEAIVKLYDQAHPGTGAPAGGTAPAKPTATPPAAAPKPAVTNPAPASKQPAPPPKKL